MDLKIFHDTVRFFLNKEQGGWLSPEEIDNNAHLAQMAHFNKEYDAYGKNQKVQDSLSPFVVRDAFSTPITGLIELPIDEDVNPCYEHFLGAYIQYSEGLRTRHKPIKIISEDEIGERLGSQILQPTVLDPVGVESGKGKIQLYPEATMIGYLYYLRRPLKPVFVYTQTDRAIIYDEPGSQQLEWQESSINKILVKTVQMFGVNLSDEMIIQYTEIKQQQEM